MAKYRKAKIKAHHIEMGSERKWGYEIGGTVYLDRSMTGPKHLEIAIHEFLHVLYPNATETEIEHHAVCLTKSLWALDYRRVDNKDLYKFQV